MEFLQLPPREALLYASCYCEENIYKFIEKHVPASSLKNYTVLFLSNSRQRLALFSQQLQTVSVNPVIWDYHVILAYHPDHTLEELLRRSDRTNAVEEIANGSEGLTPEPTKTYIYDFDTTVPTFPCPFSTYFSETFSPPPSSHFINPLDRWLMLRALKDDVYKRYFRLIPASTYLQYFSSSREHMKNEDGTWKKAPPVWDLIEGEKSEHETFGEYIDFGKCENLEEIIEEDKEYLGTMVDEGKLWEVFGGGALLEVEEIDARTADMIQLLSEYD
ncbi:hypothetical protein H072_5240 [Dactylellina haptotyla CBS 200.50]|uniref:Protein N-terminal glutamine amidohydrolase n=1 Tax=Dactylellina haptotyla (strain CBS 200.50) TaxID=1284197 RepID=S8BZZ8_DACHA|nr:hypothetical protein H072_5240 [Dactylellina haptotyla CBS 200.50]